MTEKRIKVLITDDQAIVRKGQEVVRGEPIATADGQLSVPLPTRR